MLSLELKEKGGSQEGKWVSKETEREQLCCAVLRCPRRAGLIELMSLLLNSCGLGRCVQVCECEEKGNTDNCGYFFVFFLRICRAWRPSRGLKEFSEPRSFSSSLSGEIEFASDSLHICVFLWKMSGGRGCFLYSRGPHGSVCAFVCVSVCVSNMSSDNTLK